jgi:hypothetical protein
MTPAAAPAVRCHGKFATYNRQGQLCGYRKKYEVAKTVAEHLSN